MADDIEVGKWVKTSGGKFGMVARVGKGYLHLKEVNGWYPVSVQYTGNTVRRLRRLCKLVCKPQRVQRAA